MPGTTIGLLHPGEMGSAVGRCLVEQGHTVLWVPQGRGTATAHRAAAAGLTEAASLDDLAGRSEGVLSVSPQTVRALAEVVTKAGADFTDGGIIGLPPKPGSADGPGFYLSGDGAAAVVALFGGTPIRAEVVGGGIGAASAVKLAYAAWTKGSAAL